MVKKTTRKGLEVCEVDGFQFARKRKSTSKETESLISTDRMLDGSLLLHDNNGNNNRNSSTCVDILAASPKKKRYSVSPSNSSQPVLEDFSKIIQLNLNQLLSSLPSDYPLSDKLQSLLTSGLLSSSVLSQSSPDLTVAGAIKPIIDRFSQLLCDHINEYKEALQGGSLTDNLAIRSHPALLLQLLDLNKLDKILRLRLSKLETEARQWDVQRSAELYLRNISSPLTSQHMSPMSQRHVHHFTVVNPGDKTSKTNNSLTTNAPQESEDPSLPSMELIVSETSAATVGSIATLIDHAKGVMKRADDVCKEFQTELHRDMSAPFRHMNSPAMLIRSLSLAN